MFFLVLLGVTTSRPLVVGELLRMIIKMPRDAIDWVINVCPCVCRGDPWLGGYQFVFYLF